MSLLNSPKKLASRSRHHAHPDVQMRATLCCLWSPSVQLYEAMLFNGLLMQVVAQFIFTEQPGPDNCLSHFGIALAQAKSPTHEFGPLVQLKLSSSYERAEAIAGFVVANRPLRLAGLQGRKALLSTYTQESP